MPHQMEKRWLAPKIAASADMSFSSTITTRNWLNGWPADLLGALEGGGAAIVIATEDHRREFESRLEQADADLTAARDSGAYLAMDVSQTVREFTRVRRRLRGPARYCPSRLCTAWAPLTRWRAAGG